MLFTERDTRFRARKIHLNENFSTFRNLFDCVRVFHHWRRLLSILFQVNMKKSGHSLKNKICIRHACSVKSIHSEDSQNTLLN